MKSSNKHFDKTVNLQRDKSWRSVRAVGKSDKTAREWLLGGLPGAGRGVCGSCPLLAALPGRVVHSVTGKQGEDEMWRLGTVICLAFDLTRSSHLTKPLIIHTCREQCDSQCSRRRSFSMFCLLLE